VAALLVAGMGQISLAQPSVPMVVKSVQIKGSTIVAFLPPAVESQRDEADIEALAHVRFALADAIKCLAPRRVVVELVFADKVVLRERRSAQSMSVAQLGQGVGAVLVEPGRKPQEVFTEIGPSTLLHLLPNAVDRYWDAPACKTF
jgi:hypothetical protein